jgi:nickel-type superoxide dismutase maturation protease
MVPTLAAGDFVLAAPGVAVAVGDVVVAWHPEQDSVVVIKRVAAMSADGLDLRGDAVEASTDSRSWGLVDPGRVLGRVTSRV